MSDVRILADDFTGALDAAAPFATRDVPVRLILSEAGEKGAKLTISSESRDLPVDESRAAVDRSYQLLGKGDGPDAKPALWFKKVDSVLRGNSIAETIEMMHRGNFSACVFAPAFPEMGRRTHDGLHEVRVGDGWDPAAVHDLIAAFAEQGVDAKIFTPDQPVEGVLIGNAVVQEDLDKIVAHCRGIPGVLWAGSRGLAQALTPEFKSIPQPELSAIIAGTAHPVTRQQVANAVAKGLGTDASATLLVDPVPTAPTAQDTTNALMRDVPNLSVRPNTGLMVIGGDTLSAVLAASNAETMECLGEIAPGLPISRILGGQFDGVEIVTKSGGFGDEALLERMLA
ncbi:hypothetical protein LPB41_20015 [Thalassospira sp. MA62]|nr:hypothetical protein [Thalassospira sp. MA62]